MEVTGWCAVVAGWDRGSAGWSKPFLNADQSLDRIAHSPLRRGIGIAAAFKNVGFSFGYQENCWAKIELGGEAEIEEVLVSIGTAEVGQGSHTVIRQMAAEALGVDISGANPADAGKIVADCIVAFMQELEMPNGLSAVGYTRDDVPALVEGTLPQHRVTKLSPRPAGPEELSKLFEDAMSYW